LQDLAGALHNLANVHACRGDFQAAYQLIAEAEELQRRAVKMRPTDLVSRHYLANHYDAGSALLRKLGRDEAAETSALRAFELRQELAREFPGVSLMRESLADSALQRATMLWRLGRVKESERQSLLALDQARDLAADFPSVHTYRALVARVLNSLGKLRRHQGNFIEAEQHTREAHDLAEQLVRESPSDPESRDLLAKCCCNVAEVVAEASRYDAERLLERAVAERTKLVRDFPTAVELRASLCGVHVKYGHFLQHAGRADRAEMAYRQAEKVGAAMIRERAASSQIHHDVGLCHLNLSALYSVADRKADARREADQAVVVFTKLSAAAPHVPVYRLNLIRAWINLASALDGADEQLKVAQRAVAAGQRLFKEFPDHRDHRDALARALVNHASALEQLSRYGEAIEINQAAIRHFETLATNYPHVASYTISLAYAQRNQGLLLRRIKNDKQATLALEQALATLDRLSSSQELPQLAAFHKATWHRQLGKQYAAMPGQQQRAEEHFLRGIELVQPLSRQHRESMDYAFLLGALSLDYAYQRRCRGDLLSARRFLQQSVENVSAAYAADAGKRRDLLLAYVHLSDVSTQLGNHVAAIEAAEKAVALARNEPYPWHALAKAQIAGEQLHAAASTYRKAIRGPGSRDKKAGASYQSALSWLLATTLDKELHNPQEAVRLANSAVDNSNGSADWRTLGVAHYAAGNWSDAADALQKSMELAEGGDAVEWLLLATALWHLHGRDIARTWQRKWTCKEGR